MPSRTGAGTWWGVGRQVFLQKAAAAKPAQRAAMVKYCQDKAQDFDAWWPALAASWRADAEMLQAIGRAKEARQAARAAPAAA